MNCSEKKFLSILPQINFVLSFLIVFHHSFISYIGYNGSYSPMSYGYDVAIERYMYNLSECAVPFFFFLSAFLFYRTYEGTLSLYIYKMRRRFWSLFMPYIIFSTIGFLKVIILKTEEIEDGIEGWLLTLWLSNTMPLWFIRELIALSILAPIIYIVKNSFWVSLILSIIIICMAAFNMISQRSFLYWMPIYLMGARLNSDKIDMIKKLLDKKDLRYVAYFLLLLYSVTAWFLPNGLEKEPFNCILYTLFRLATPCVFGVVIWLFINNKMFKRRKWMQYSFWVYCVHAPILSLVKMIYDKIIFFDVEIVKYLFVSFAVYICCVSIAMFLEHYTPKCWSILNGKR